MKGSGTVPARDVPKGAKTMGKDIVRKGSNKKIASTAPSKPKC